MTLQEIQKKIDTANNAYYTLGQEVMADELYDSLKEQLKKLNPDDPRLKSVGASVRNSILEKTKHTIPMGSLNKCLNEQEWNKWLDLNLLRSTTFTASYKMDGSSVSLEYREGKLVCAITRGDGLEGEDITANALKFNNLPPTVILPNGEMFNGFVRGEIILTLSDWKEIDPESNARNLATGISRRKSGEQAEFLKFYAFRVYNSDGELMGDLEEDLFELMEKMGFDVSPNVTGKPDVIWKWFESIYKKRSELNYLIDGIVVSINDIDKQLEMGESGGCPKGAMAIKFVAEGAITKVNNVIWGVGHSGVVSPVAEVEPVKVGGVTISNVTLCNTEYIETLGVCVNDDVNLIRAGDVIPRVMSVANEAKNRIPIVPPTKCPCCNSKLERKENINGEESTAIYCVNKECPAIVNGKIDKYLSSLNILGIGTEVIEALVNAKLVNDAADLYVLNEKAEQVADLKLSGKTRFGEKRTEKLLEEIEQKRELSVADFLGSLGIQGLGKRRVVICQENTKGQLDKLVNWTDGSIVVLAKEAGIPNIAYNINKDIQLLRPLIDKFIKNGLVVKETSTIKKEIPKGATVICITGKLSREKKFFYDLIEKKGYIGTDDFSKSVTHLVAADPSSGSGKLKKAAKNGIPILSEDDLMKMLQN